MEQRYDEYPGHGDGCTMKTVRKINAEFNEIVNGR